MQESFQAYSDAALRYEAQQRAWSELNHKPIAPFKEKGKGKTDKGKSKGKGKSKNDERQTEKTETCSCFECDKAGYISRDCPLISHKSSDGKSKFKGKSQDTGKGKSKSKKGKQQSFRNPQMPMMHGQKQMKEVVLQRC